MNKKKTNETKQRRIRRTWNHMKNENGNIKKKSNNITNKRNANNKMN